MYLDYINKRRKDRFLKYRLNRRTKEILGVIQAYKKEKELKLLDIGTADASMLKILKSELCLSKAVGVDPYLYVQKNLDVYVLKGLGEYLPIKGNAFDIVVAASVIDHVQDANGLLKECYRVLKEEGLLIVTAAVHFFDKVAVVMKYKPDDHTRTYNLKLLKKLFEKNKMTVLLTEKFALPSFGLIPFEDQIEKILRLSKLDFLMFYNLIVGQVKK
jgi:ubiquinone/menaquinone biosynthesis C-methylase UbiE